MPLTINYRINEKTKKRNRSVNCNLKMMALKAFLGGVGPVLIHSMNMDHMVVRQRDEKCKGSAEEKMLRLGF